MSKTEYLSLNDDDEVGRSSIRNFGRSVMNKFVCIPVSCFTTCCCVCCDIFYCCCCILFLLVIGFLIFVIIINSFYTKIRVKGRNRYYIWHVPRDSAEPLPLLLGLHGGSGNPLSFSRRTKISGVADKEGFIAIYPQGTCAFLHFLCVWSSGTVSSKDLEVQDEIDFLDTLIDRLESNPPWKGKYSVTIDKSRIYMMGHSNGAMMTYTYATRGNNKLAAIAPVSGSMGGENAKTGDWYYPPSQSSMKLHVLEVHGKRDKNVNIDGGHPSSGYKSQRKRIDEPMSYSLDYWLNQNECTTKNISSAKIVEEKDMDGAYVLSTYSSCPNGTSVRSLVITDGEHYWSTIEKPIKDSSAPKTAFCEGSDSLAELIYNLIKIE